jgi:putative lipoic acid-binding regulatory protein
METLNAGEDRETLLQFPCTYPLKVMGRNTEEFQVTVRSIIERHVPEVTQVRYSSRASSGDKYLSITATLVAQSQEQLKVIYSELAGNNLVLAAF